MTYSVWSFDAGLSRKEKEDIISSRKTIVLFRSSTFISPVDPFNLL